MIILETLSNENGNGSYDGSKKSRTFLKDTTCQGVYTLKWLSLLMFLWQANVLPTLLPKNRMSRLTNHSEASI